MWGFSVSILHLKDIHVSKTGWVLQEEVLPRLRSAIPQVVNFVGSEDAQELVQDATAMAARLMHKFEKIRKKVTSGNIACSPFSTFDLAGDQQVHCGPMGVEKAS
jgi:hypothetical protein